MSEAPAWVAALVAGVVADVRERWECDVHGLETPVAVRDEVRRLMLDLGIDAQIHVSYGRTEGGATTLRLATWSEHDVRGPLPGIDW